MNVMKNRFKIFLMLIFSTISIYSNDDCCTCGHQGKGSSETPKPFIGDEASAALVRSGDPNELDGPAGYDSVRWVSVNDVLHYTIFFENAEEIAGANAQIIDVRFRFPYAEMMNSFQLGEYNFALHNYPIATKGNAYKTRIDLRDSMFIYVDLVAGLDISQQQGYWHFTSIDPITGIAPWQFDRGLLPVNDSTHIGEGYVTFSMQPLPTMQTGDTISLYADILFDQNDTIPTNRWCNRVDAGAPQSTIINTPDEATPLLYHLSFTASDDLNGCGVKRVLLYQTDNMGTWQEIGAFPADTVIDMQLELGDSYKLISIAEDHVGNREPFKLTPDLILNANLAPSDILLSDSTFRDDLPDKGYIATITSIDTEEGRFIYAFAEGEGAIHNDLFLIEEDHLLLRNSLSCADDTVYQIRLSTTDQGGMSFSKPFRLVMTHVLIHPENDTIQAKICEGESYSFFDTAYAQAGTYIYKRAVSEHMCDSTYVIELSILPIPQKPMISIEQDSILVSSASEGNQWMRCEEGESQLVSTENRFVPSVAGKYIVRIDNGACSSEPSDTITVQWHQDSVSLTLNLAEGWNWFSSYLVDEPNRNVASFLQPIQSSVDSLCGNTPVVSALSLKESYKIRTNQSVQHTWYGIACNADESLVTLQQGWNRIGYPLSYVTNLTNTWSDFLPSEGDIIKTYEAFSVFHGGQWIGTLQTLSPGDGIMYYTQSARTMQFAVANAHLDIHPVSRRILNENLPLNTAVHRYPDNATLIAVLKDTAEQEMTEGVYTVMAYVANEMVGIGSYVNGQIHMLIYGDMEIASPVRFNAYNHITQQTETIAEQLTFSNEPTGSIMTPFVFHLLPQSATDLMTCTYSGQYAVYPNPVRDRLYVTGETENIRSLAIYSLDGVVVARFAAVTEAGLPVGNLVDGTYLVAIETADGEIHIRKIIKQNLSSAH